MTSESNAVDAESDPSTASEQPRIVRYLLLAASFLPVVAMTVAVFIFRNDIDRLRTIEGLETIGFVGILIANVIGSGSFVLPVPGIATVIIGATIWNPLLVALAGGTGSTIGELAAYLAGVGSYGAVRRFAGRSRWYVTWYSRLRGWIEARGMITIFLFAATPNPFFDIAGFAAGSMRYPIGRFTVACWLGKMVKYGFVSYAAFWGADMVYGWFE
ncbi:MAG: VTT domain-containing protein [Chloroflexi bacterium]|nr:VTT domain-containing protein [Chloroflexota bacterium]